MREVLTVLRIRTGHDFSNYKAGTLQRRVERRVHLLGLLDIHEYAKVLRENPQEALALMKELLISVTNFFRDPAAFDALNVRILPRILSNTDRQDQIRVWVPGCATGEEAYSIAMLLAEHAGAAPDQPPVQVFATDLDEQAIAAAREGFYTNADVADVSEERLLRFFVREPGGYRVRRDLRETVLFAVHNVIRDPPFSHLDLISCRNLLIYLNRPVQERVIETFHFALRPGGFLFLGPSESAETPQRSLRHGGQVRAHLREPQRQPPAWCCRRSIRSRCRRGSRRGRPTRGRSTASRPATCTSGCSNATRRRRWWSPKTTWSCTFPSGSDGSCRCSAASRPVTCCGWCGRTCGATCGPRCTRRPSSGANVEVRGVLTALEDGEYRVDICVYPVLREEEPARGYLLVTFDVRPAEPAAITEEGRRLVPHREPLAQQLEEETARLKQQLRATIEQYETQAEEAKASNEELQAMNEELRSSAEELETSKEELQSVNEELTTVNQELKIKIEELGLSQQRLPEPDQLQRYRHDLPRPAAAGEAVHAGGRAGLQPAALRTSAGRCRTSPPRSPPTGCSTTSQQRPGRAADRGRGVQTRDGRWILTRLRPVPDHRRSHRRRRHHAPGHHRPAQRREPGPARRGTAPPADRRRHRLRDLHHERRRHDRLLESRRRADVRLPGGGDRRPARGDAVHGRGSGRRTSRAASSSRPARTAAPPTSAFTSRKNGTRFYCSGITIKLGEALGFAKIARDLSTPTRRPRRCGLSRRTSSCACASAPTSSRPRSARAPRRTTTSRCCCSASSPHRRTNGRASPGTCTITSASSSPRCG